MPHTDNGVKTSQSIVGTSTAVNNGKARGMDNSKKRKLDDDVIYMKNLSPDSNSIYVHVKHAVKTGQDISSHPVSHARQKQLEANTPSVKASVIARNNSPVNAKTAFSNTKGLKKKRVDALKMPKIGQEPKQTSNSISVLSKEQGNTLPQQCSDQTVFESTLDAIAKLPVAGRRVSILRSRKPISRFTDTTMRYKRSYLSSAAKEKPSVTICQSDKVKKILNLCDEAAKSCTSSQKTVNKGQTSSELQATQHKVSVVDNKVSSVNQIKKTFKPMAHNVRGKPISKFSQTAVKKERKLKSCSQSIPKSFGFWRSSRLRRMASLNAQAKVHILYENDARSSSPEEKCEGECDLDVPKDSTSALSEISSAAKVQEVISTVSKIPPKPQQRSKKAVVLKVVDSKKGTNKAKISKMASKKQKPNMKSRKMEVPVISCTPKRMASLNAQAILAASYSSERYRFKPCKSTTIKGAGDAPAAVLQVPVADKVLETKHDTIGEIIDAVASGKIKCYRRILIGSAFKNKTSVKSKATFVSTKTVTKQLASKSSKPSMAGNTQNCSVSVKRRYRSTATLETEVNKRRRHMSYTTIMTSGDTVTIGSPKQCEISTGDSEKPNEKKEGYYQDECDPEKDDLGKNLDISKVVITTTELQPAIGSGTDKISVKAEAIRRDKIEDTAEVTITGMYINPVTNTSQRFRISRIHTYKQASSTLSYTPPSIGEPTTVHVGVGPQQQVVGGASSTTTTVISPQSQAPPQPQISTLPAHHVAGSGVLHAGHINTPAAHMRGGPANLCPYSNAAATQPCGMGGVPLVDVGLQRHYGSAFTVPHYGHHYAHGYYPSPGPLLQSLADPCLIHKPVPFHPHSFQPDHCHTHTPSGAPQSMQPFPTVDQCHTHPPAPYPPPGPGPGGPQQSQQHYAQNADAATSKSSLPLSSIVTVGGMQCGLPGQLSDDNCKSQPPKPSNVPNATSACFADPGCQSCAAAAAAAAVQFSSTAAQHYSVSPAGPNDPASAVASPPPSTPAVSANLRQFSARSRTRIPSTIIVTASPSDPYGRLPPTKPDVGRQNALPIQTQTDHALDVPPMFAPKMVKVENVERNLDGSESNRRDNEPGTPKDFVYNPPVGHHHMETRRLRMRSYPLNRSPPLPVNAITNRLNRGESGPVAMKNLRNKPQNLTPASKCTSRKNGHVYAKRQLRHKDITITLTSDEDFKKTMVRSWLRSPKQLQQRRQVEGMRKSLLIEEESSRLETTVMTTAFSTRRNKYRDNHMLTEMEKSAKSKGISNEPNKELVIRTRRLDIGSLRECGGKLRMRDVTNERSHLERSYRPLNHHIGNATTHENSNHLSSSNKVLPLHKGYNERHPDYRIVTTRRASSSSTASTTSSCLSSPTPSSHYSNEKVPRPYLRSKATKKLPRYSNGWTWEGQPFQQAIHIHNDDPPILRKCFPAMRHIQGDIIRVRDCVLLKSGPRKNDLPYVAKVTALWENSEDGEMMFSLLWYYRPEHTEQGRKPHHMEDEIFASKHQDMNSVACIEDKCYVLTFHEYCRYRCRSRMLEEGLRPRPSVVPDSDDGYPRKDRQPPGCISPEMIFFCRKVYEFRQKRILKNPT